MKLNSDKLTEYGPFKADLCMNAEVYLNGERLERCVFVDTRAGIVSQLAADRNGGLFTWGHMLTGYPIPNGWGIDADMLDELVTVEHRGEVGVRHCRTGKKWGRCA